MITTLIPDTSRRSNCFRNDIPTAQGRVCTAEFLYTYYTTLDFAATQLLAVASCNYIQYDPPSSRELVHSCFVTTTLSRLFQFRLVTSIYIIWCQLLKKYDTGEYFEKKNPKKLLSSLPALLNSCNQNLNEQEAYAVTKFSVPPKKIALRFTILCV